MTAKTGRQPELAADSGTRKIRVVHYLNQFFAGIGGEEHASEPPGRKAGAVGPGIALQQQLAGKAEVVGTVFCGDNYVSEHGDEAVTAIVSHIAEFRPDLVVAGPAFAAGRYGLACGRIGSAVVEQLNVAVVTGMHVENPAVAMYRRDVYIVPTGENAAHMRDAIQRVVAVALKLADAQRNGSTSTLTPSEAGYLPRGLRFNRMATEPAATRAVDKLIRSLSGEEVDTEWPGPEYDRVVPPPPVNDLSRATLMLVTTSGIVPKGNPDRIESTYATKWAKYDLTGVTALTADKWQTYHGGYDTRHINADPNRALPVDVLRELESAGVFAHLVNFYYVSVGSGQSTTNAKKFAREIIRDLRDSTKVDGIILVAT